MLIIKFLIALAIMLVMIGPSPLKSQSMTNSISDKEIFTMITIVDKSIVSYYVSHAGELPSSLDENVRVAMGLENVDLSPFTYVKVDDNTFRLTATLSNSTLTSVNSNRELIEIEPITQ